MTEVSQEQVAEVETKTLYTEAEMNARIEAELNERTTKIRKTIEDTTHSAKEALFAEKKKVAELEEQLKQIKQAKPMENLMSETATETKIEPKVEPKVEVKVEPKVEVQEIKPDLSVFEKRLAELEEKLTKTQLEAKTEIERTQQVAVALVNKAKGEAFLEKEMTKAELSPAFASLVKGNTVEEIAESIKQAKEFQAKAEEELLEKNRARLSAAVPKSGITGPSMVKANPIFDKISSSKTSEDFAKLLQEASEQGYLAQPIPFTH